MKNKNHNKRRSIEAYSMIVRTGNHAGPMHEREHDNFKGRNRKVKHKNRNCGEE